MLRKNVAGQFIHIQGVDATTGGIKSGVTWTMRRCLDGTFAAGGATITEDGTAGWYKVALTQADTNGNDIGYNFTGTGAIPVTVNVITTAADPTDGVRFGLTALPNASPASSGGLPTTDANNAVKIQSGVKKNVALPSFEFVMNDSTNHQPVTGKTVTVTRSIDNGAFAAGTLSAVTEIGAGVYSVDFAAADLNGGVITLQATAAGCDTRFVTIRTDP